MTGRIKGVNHTSFTVSDLERTMAYFTKVLGFAAHPISPRDPELVQTVTAIPGASMLVGYVEGYGQKVELVKYTGPDDCGKIESRSCDTGFAHFAVDVEGLDEVAAALKEHGVHPVGGIGYVAEGPNRGSRAMFLRDWDGVCIELIETVSAAQP
ncbi:VOC family protein [Allosphingosinicella sp.]|uniref:VOC family protein n=1 Tax=Allosphingosinicella sp. TaxID=2823234 RepID=UPI002FC1B34F